MRLLYQYAVRSISKKNCRLIINSLKSRVAASLTAGPEEDQSQASLPNIVHEFITTSRPVEDWIQEIEESVRDMGSGKEKVPPELWMVIGGNGSGKTHIKVFIRRKRIPNLEYLELDAASLLLHELSMVPIVDDIFPLMLLYAKGKINALYRSMNNEENSLTNNESTKNLEERVREYISDDEFVDAFCKHGELPGDLKHLQELIIKGGSRIYLPLLKMYKKYLGVKGVCIFIDEFEKLHGRLNQTRERMIESIEALYDTFASTFQDSEYPSFKMIILCTLSFWNELKEDVKSRAFTTRVHLFEILPLKEDEIIALAEKLYVLHKKSDPQKHIGNLDFTKLPPYLLKIAGIDEPLTPRFIIEHIISLIEKPDEYNRYLYSTTTTE